MIKCTLLLSRRRMKSRLSSHAIRTCASARSRTIRAGAFIESLSSDVPYLFAQKAKKIKSFAQFLHRPLCCGRRGFQPPRMLGLPPASAADLCGLGAHPHPDALRASTLPLQGRVLAAACRDGYDFLPYAFG